jgi:hypothetical protein
MSQVLVKWIAWIGLWLLIAANARADVVGVASVPPAAARMPEPFWGIVTMTLVLCLWGIVAQAIARLRSQRMMAQARIQRKRPPFPL